MVRDAGSQVAVGYSSFGARVLIVISIELSTSGMPKVIPNSDLTIALLATNEIAW